MADILDGADQDFVDNMADALEDFLNKPPFVKINPESIERAAVDAFCGQLFKAYQEQAVERIGKVPIISQEKSTQYGFVGLTAGHRFARVVDRAAKGWGWMRAS